MKRALSLVLVFIMILTLIPAVYAADTELQLSVNGLSVTCSETMTWIGDDNVGKLDHLNENDTSYIDWEVSPNGEQIIAGLNPCSVAQCGATITFKNELSIAATLRFEYILNNEDAYAMFCYLDNYDPYYEDYSVNIIDKSFEMELDAGESYALVVVSHDPQGYTGTTNLTISNISLSTGSDATVTFTPAENGSYTVGDVQITGDTSYTVAPGTKYSLSATPAEDYQFFGWYNGSDYISHDADYVFTVAGDTTIYPVFIANTASVFGVGERRFQDLAAADTYAQSSPVKTIVVMNDAVISGEYTISAGNTLLIPYDDANTVHTEATTIAVQEGGTWKNVAWKQPEPYRTLTMTEDSKLIIKGSLNVGGRHSSGPFLTAGSPSGDLGMINMASGSNITVANGGQLYCWGYIYGSGTVTAENGASVHENFQFSDFRGGNYTLGLAEGFLVFPISQYYVQNIEVATTFEYGATEFVWGSIYLQSKVYVTSVKFIGTNANLDMFVPGVNGSVTKTYDPKTDRLIIDVSGDGSINPMGLELGGTTINTQTFVLPINSNMTININSGTTSLNQSLALLPGSKLNIAQGARLALNSAEPLKDKNGNVVHYQGANNLIIYDRDQWLSALKPVMVNGELVGAEFVDAKFVYTSPGGLKRLQPLAYSPTRTYTRTENDLVDAVVDINGTLATDGYIYTTVDIDLQEYFFNNKNVVITGGGASVISSKGTGNLVMNNGSGPDTITLQPLQTSDQVEYAYILMASARLKNADGTYVDTLNSTEGAQYIYCAACNGWRPAQHIVEITWIVDGKDGTQEVCVGTKPVYNFGTDPVKEGYEFIGWSTGNDNVPEYTSANLPNAESGATYWACFEEEAQGMLGDFDNSNEVDAADLTLLARHVAGIEDLTGQALENADVNSDGVISAEDITTHARYIAGIITEWPKK